VDKQERYNELAKEIYKNNNLDESQRLEFYQLHKTVSEPEDCTLFHKLFELGFVHQLKYQENIKYKFSGAEEEKQIIEFLEEKVKTDGLTRDLYELLVYLAHKNSIQTTVNSPAIPKIQNLDFSLFKTKFNYTDRRKYLLRILESFLRYYFSLYQVGNIRLLVGGGFLDLKDSPNDIDLIILMEYKAFCDSGKISNLKQWISQQKSSSDIKPPLDIMKLPTDNDLSSFLAYQQLTMIGNDVSEKLTHKIKNNIYSGRDIYKIKINE